jgi:hypothetical protein
MTIYKIRNAAGLYSMGGSYPRFSKNGKIWNSLATLRSHLHMVSGWSDKMVNVYVGCEIVEFESVIKTKWLVQGELETVRLKKLKKREERLIRSKSYQEELEKKQLKELIKKYPDSVGMLVMNNCLVDISKKDKG